MEIDYTVKTFEELSNYELYDIMRLRQEVFVVEQNCPFVDADNLDQHSLHVQGRDKNNKLMTYTRLIDKGVAYPDYSSIGRVVNHSQVRSTGEGHRLMQFSVDKIKEIYPGPIKIGAQSYLQRFYEKFGFVDVGQPYIEDGIPHMVMILKA
jgi:ElaA protein